MQSSLRQINVEFPFFPDSQKHWNVTVKPSAPSDPVVTSEDTNRFSLWSLFFFLTRYHSRTITNPNQHYYYLEDNDKNYRGYIHKEQSSVLILSPGYYILLIPTVHISFSLTWWTTRSQHFCYHHIPPAPVPRQNWDKHLHGHFFLRHFPECCHTFLCILWWRIIFNKVCSESAQSGLNNAWGK